MTDLIEIFAPGLPTLPDYSSAFFFGYLVGAFVIAAIFLRLKARRFEGAAILAIPVIGVVLCSVLFNEFYIVDFAPPDSEAYLPRPVILCQAIEDYISSSNPNDSNSIPPLYHEWSALLSTECSSSSALLTYVFAGFLAVFRLGSLFIFLSLFRLYKAKSATESVKEKSDQVVSSLQDNVANKHEDSPAEVSSVDAPRSVVMAFLCKQKSSPFSMASLDDNKKKEVLKAFVSRLSGKPELRAYREVFALYIAVCKENNNGQFEAGFKSNDDTPEAAYAVNMRYSTLKNFEQQGVSRRDVMIQLFEWTAECAFPSLDALLAAFIYTCFCHDESLVTNITAINKNLSPTINAYVGAGRQMNS